MPFYVNIFIGYEIMPEMCVYLRFLLFQSNTAPVYKTLKVFLSHFCICEKYDTIYEKIFNFFANN